MTKRNFKYVKDKTRPRMVPYIGEGFTTTEMRPVPGEFHGKKVSANLTTWNPNR